jgi:hypothetical protein
MDKTEKELLVDPGDWYSELFAGDSDSNKSAKHSAEDSKKEEVMESSGLSAEQVHHNEEDEESREMLPADRGSGRNIPVALFFSFSLLIFMSCLFVLCYFNGIETIQRIRLSKPHREYISSYLSYEAKQTMAQSVLHLLRENRAGLESVLRELKGLDDEKAAFLEDMEQRERMYMQNRSVFGLTGTEKTLQSIAGLVRSDVEFRGEKRRRVLLYLDLYDRKKRSLLAQKAEYEKTIAGLTSYQDELYRIDTKSVSDVQESFFLDTIRAADIEKFLYFIENGDYKRAGDAIRALEPLSSGEANVIVKLMSRLSALLQEYNRRIVLLTKRSPFEEISLAYLNEQYDEVEKNIDTFEKEGFLKPLLSGIDGSLYSNKTAQDRYKAEIEQNKKLAGLVRKAASFEKQKEYPKAIDIYQNLLVFRLSSYDREMVLNKLRTAWLAHEQEKIRRDENTQAIKYMDSARILSREGKDDDALRYYRLLLQKCPNSDFTGEAVEGIIRTTSLQKIPE